ncbi:MAG: PhnA-like protein, partial [Hyphomicrobiaceae bacterium]|nr:PhnA-like protein [Hyphomicrobiaceae bacterium]
EQQYRQTVQSAKDQATKAAESTTKVVSRGALFGSIALILGALAGWFGGRMGAVDPTITSAALMSMQRRLH